MELITYKDNCFEYTFYWSKDCRRIKHGEYKVFYGVGAGRENYFLYHGWLHGECKIWNEHDMPTLHCFYIDGEEHPYIEMTKQEKLLFQIQHPGFRFIEG